MRLNYAAFRIYLSDKKQYRYAAWPYLSCYHLYEQGVPWNSQIYSYTVGTQVMQS